jgi:hypothetical protein
MKLEFPRQILEKPQITNFMKILPVGVELSMRTHKTKPIVACCNVAKAPKIGKDYLLELFGPLLTRPVMIKMTMERPGCCDILV